jgi:hypothetical protein
MEKEIYVIVEGNRKDEGSRRKDRAMLGEHLSREPCRYSLFVYQRSKFDSKTRVQFVHFNCTNHITMASREQEIDRNSFGSIGDHPQEMAIKGRPEEQQGDAEKRTRSTQAKSENNNGDVEI